MYTQQSGPKSGYSRAGLSKRLPRPCREVGDSHRRALPRSLSLHPPKWESNLRNVINNN